MDEDIEFEKFYVFRRMTGDEKWNAVLLESSLGVLDNIDFGMKIFARNEKEAIARGKAQYDVMHSNDGYKRTILRFVESYTTKHGTTLTPHEIVHLAINLYNECDSHFKRKEGETNE